MPGSVAPKVVRQIGPIVSTGVSQLIKHRVGRAPRFVDIVIENIDMATPGQYTNTLNSKDSEVLDITVIPVGMTFFLTVGK